MTTYIKEFEFEKAPLKITYLNDEPLKLTNELIFFHNKSKFRKKLTSLQYLIKSYTKIALHAAGIRDSYLKADYSEKFLVVLFATPEIVKKTNEIVKIHSGTELNPSCFYLETASNYMLLLSRDIEGLTNGLKTMEIILKQVLEDYMHQNNFDDYIKIRPFKLLDCRIS